MQNWSYHSVVNSLSLIKLRADADVDYKITLKNQFRTPLIPFDEVQWGTVIMINFNDLFKQIKESKLRFI